jgi:two-component system, OmpR family, phosphate regulon sensor histidine kinase PhoR
LEKLGTEFVANVSHELKTPLTSIIGFVETLKGGAIDDEKNRGKFLQIIDEHAQKLGSLIEDLLVLSRLESGRDHLRKETFDLEPMISRLLALFQHTIDTKRIRVFLELPTKPFLVLADAKLIEQAFSNLIENAVKYNRLDGEIRIRAFPHPRETVIEFEDTGIGIPEQDLPRIFERFYRVDRSRSRESGGTGLGLSIVKHIVERHAGRVEISSVLQKGSTLTIFIPSFEIP